MHDSSHLPHERRQTIARRLLRGEAVVAAALAEEFAISDDAIRRDLRALAQDGLCRRVYGGALPVSPASTTMAVRSREDIARKRALAQAANALVRPGQTLFLDTGSTNLQLATLLPSLPGLRVVTNSIPVAAALMARTDLSLVVIGGTANPAAGGCVDAHAIAEVRRCRVDLAFLGACAVSMREGLGGFDMADVDFKRTLLDISAAVALMLTNAKVETAAPFRICATGRVDHYVLEADAPPSFVSALRRSPSSVTLAAAPAS